MRTAKTSATVLLLFSYPPAGPLRGIAPAVSTALDPVAARPAAGRLRRHAVLAEQGARLGPAQAPVTPLAQDREFALAIGRLSALDGICQGMEAPADLPQRRSDLVLVPHHSYCISIASDC